MWFSFWMHSTPKNGEGVSSRDRLNQLVNCYKDASAQTL